MTEVILAICLGGLFGYALYTVGAAKRSNIRSMLRLEQLSLMKIILFAIGFAAALLALAAYVELLDLKHLSIKPTNAGVILGGLIFGVGFGTLGSCPGTSLASLPYGNKVKTLGMVLGGLVGAWAFSMTYAWWVEQGLFATWNQGKLTLFQISDAYPALLPGGCEGLFLFGCLLMGIAYILPHSFLRG